jgi:hypothetical protein
MKDDRLQHTIDLLKRYGEEKGMTITGEEMAWHLGMTGEELAAYLKDPGKTQEEYSAMSDRLRAAYPELFRNVRTVTHTVQLHQMKTPLVVELDWEELGDE